MSFFFERKIHWILEEGHSYNRMHEILGVNLVDMLVSILLGKQRSGMLTLLFLSD